MQIDIKTKNITLDNPLREFVNEKIGGLEKFLQTAGQVFAVVEIGKSTKHHQKGPFFYAECNIHIGQSNQVLRATCEHENLRNAIVDVKDELQQQIKKFKEKRTDLERQPIEE